MQSDSGIAEMGVQDENEGKRSKASSGACISQFNGDTPSEHFVQSKDTSSIGNVQIPKVRKPYTITKQREKWTEEEHQKFLEALKLYGRSWRQIEEHVGTKTAVQIRSHAQKFFSKLVRESNGAGENPIRPIEIPPPRPKRKPLHPYPRKSVDFLQGHSTLNEQERSSSPKLLVAEKESLSPASVLTSHGSDGFGSASYEQTTRCLSPNSCTTEMHSVGISPIEEENDYMISNSSEEEKESSSSVPQSGGTSLENPVSVKYEPISEETESSKDHMVTFQASTIKLFGRTVSIPYNIEKPLIAGVEDLKSIACVPSQGHGVVDRETLGMALASNHLNTKLSLGLPNRNSSTQQGGEDLNSFENEQDMICSVSPGKNASLPWWSSCQGLPTSDVSHKILIPTPVFACVRERFESKESLKESSCTDSNSGSTSEVENVDKKLDDVDSQNQGPRIEVGVGSHKLVGQVGISSRKSSVGFVPYKRCLAERNADSVGSAMEERSGQRARVCS